MIHLTSHNATWEKVCEISRRLCNVEGGWSGQQKRLAPGLLYFSPQSMGERVMELFSGSEIEPTDIVTDNPLDREPGDFEWHGYPEDGISSFKWVSNGSGAVLTATRYDGGTDSAWGDVPLHHVEWQIEYQGPCPDEECKEFPDSGYLHVFLDTVGEGFEGRGLDLSAFVKGSSGWRSLRHYSAWLARVVQTQIVCLGGEWLPLKKIPRGKTLLMLFHELHREMEYRKKKGIETFHQEGVMLDPRKHRVLPDGRVVRYAFPA